jgi:hypothetical protein
MRDDGKRTRIGSYNGDLANTSIEGLRYYEARRVSDRWSIRCS